MPGISVSCDPSFPSRLHRISSLTPRSAAPPGPAMRRHSPIVDAFPAADSVVIRSPCWIHSARRAPLLPLTLYPNAKIVLGHASGVVRPPPAFPHHFVPSMLVAHFDLT